MGGERSKEDGASRGDSLDLPRGAVKGGEQAASYMADGYRGPGAVRAGDSIRTLARSPS